MSPSVSLRFNDASKDRLPTSHSESNSKLELRPFEVEHLQKDEKDPETESDHFFIPSDYDDLPRRFDRELLLNFFSSSPRVVAPIFSGKCVQNAFFGNGELASSILATIFERGLPF